MKLYKKSKLPGVTVIMSVYNVSPIIKQVLTNLTNQSYPIASIIVVDNKSTDNSLLIIQRFKKYFKGAHIKVIARNKTYGISDSFNLGAKIARTEYIVLMHSDSLLPSRDELSKLMKPFILNHEFLVSIPYLINRKTEWYTYNFWQKCLFAQYLNVKIKSNNGKFDAYNRLFYLSLGGYDTKTFSHINGSEDADMNFRLKKFGKIFQSKALVIHYHPKDPKYSMRDYINRRIYLARAYGIILKKHWKQMKFETLYFLIKPFIVILTLFSILNPIFLLPIIFFPFIYMKNMYFDPASRRDINILLLSLVVIYSTFIETYYLLTNFAKTRT